MLLRKFSTAVDEHSEPMRLSAFVTGYGCPMASLMAHSSAMRTMIAMQEHSVCESWIANSASTGQDAHAKA